MKKQNQYRLGTVFGAFALAVMAVASPVQAQDAKAEDKGWETVGNAGLSLTRGNSKNLLFTVGADSVRKWSKDEALLGAKLGYGSTTVDGEKNTTQHDIKGYGQYNHLFTERTYGGLRLDGLYDKVSAINYRFTLSPILGYYFIKEANTSLAGEVGPSLITEEVVSKVPFSGGGTTNRVDENTYVGLRLGERFEHKFAGGAKLWQTLEIIPQITDFDNYILTFEIGVSAPITKKLDARLVLQDVYDHVPATGRQKNDMKLIAGLGYKF
jgi:putative salt-induced outer membrane protein YdiY